MNAQSEGGIRCLDLSKGEMIKINGVILSPGILETLQTIQCWDEPRAMARVMTNHVYDLAVHRAAIDTCQEPVPGTVEDFVIPPSVFAYIQQFTDLLNAMQEISQYNKGGRRL